MHRLHVSAPAEIACDEAVGTGSSLHFVALAVLESVCTCELPDTSDVYVLSLIMSIFGPAYLTAACTSTSLNRP